MDNAEDLQATIGIRVPTEVVNAIADRVASLLAEKLSRTGRAGLRSSRRRLIWPARSRGSTTWYQPGESRTSGTGRGCCSGAPI